MVAERVDKRRFEDNGTVFGISVRSLNEVNKCEVLQDIKF
jgi:hypothetical protein